MLLSSFPLFFIYFIFCTFATALLLRNDHKTCLKPLPNDFRAKSEINFYRKVNVNPHLKLVRAFTAQYFGCVVLDHYERDSGQIYIELENLLWRFENPCVLDLKIGTRTWDTRDAKKIVSQTAKFPAQSKFGFRISGMRVYYADCHEFETFGKTVSRSITEDRIVAMLCRFFSPSRRWSYSEPCHNLCKESVRKVMNQILQLIHFFERQDHFQLIGSSLLVVYEGVACREPLVRMIDFAHIHWFSPNEVIPADLDYLHGLYVLHRILSAMLQVESSCTIEKLNRIALPIWI